MEKDSFMNHSILNILVIDDDRGDRIACQRVLKSAWNNHVQLIEADSGESGLDVIEKNKLDCVLLDYFLSGINGLEVLKRIRLSYPYLAVIMIDGKGDDANAVQAMREGAQDYISKANITAESIKRIIENALEKMTLQQKVAQQREELENFTSVLVHDLRAPTRSIMHLSKFIEEDLQAENIDINQIINNCRRTVKVAQRMDALIDTLREYTKVNEQIVFEPIEIGRMVKDTLSNLEHLILEHGAQVTYDTLPVVIGNASQLIQLFQNLISNSIKYCKVEIPSIHITAKPQDAKNWLFCVKDNGIGIDQQYYKRVFEPFKRLHSASTYEGTGLGLTTCKKIIERHGGSIWCESEKGQGTTFFFTLKGVADVVE
ncbi:MAG: ATP-binding protein [Pseudomonadota bacterium]